MTSASNRLPAIVLLSGGLDSTTVLAIAREQGFAAHALSFDYGQRHKQELIAAARVAREYGAVEHKIATIDLRLFGGSALTDAIEVPKDRSPERIDAEAEGNHMPSTYVPARNIIFLSFALAYAEVRGARDIFLGVNALDYSGYPDCRPEFLDAFQTMARLGTAQGVHGEGVTLHAPLIAMSKADIVREGMRLGVDYALTTSCYDPVADKACGRCDACALRERGFAEAGMKDPALV